MDRSLAVDRLTVRYAGARSPALLRLSLELADGVSLAVLGPAGAGKTTLLHSIAGLLHGQEHVAVEGGIRVGAGEPHSSSTMTAFPSVSMLPQDARHIISGFVPTVAEELQITLRQARIPEESWDEYIRTIRNRLPIDQLLPRSPSTLSGGELQTVALAIAAVARPAILCLDEPATALDQGRVDDLARFVMARGPRSTIILADTGIHAPVLACDQMIVLDRGTPVFSGSRQEFWQRLPEFQDLVALGAWLDVWHRCSTIDAATFAQLLARSC